MAKHENFGQSDEWYTPKYVFDALQCVFDLDVAAPIDRKFISVPAREFITEDSLSKNWGGYVWMNPPWSARGSKDVWLQKLYHHGNGIALAPDRTSTEWWQKAATQADAILFVKGKIKFLDVHGLTGNSPSTGTTLFAFGYRAIEALKSAELNQLGLLKLKN